MVLQISVESTEDIDYLYGAYTVHADDHRILTIVTNCNDTLTKWLNHLLKSIKKSLPTTLIVGVSVERETLEYTKTGVRDTPYQLLNLCVGSHSLIYHLDDYDDYEPRAIPRSLRTFFDNPRVVALGMNMKPVAQKLERDHGIKIKNPMDLRSLAIEGLKRKDLDLGRYDLDNLAKTVLGKHMDVVRPEKKLKWYDYPYWWSRKLSLDKVGYATIDAYLCFLVGSELLDMKKNVGASGSSKKTKKNKKN